MGLPNFVRLITYFTLFYPIVMSVVWIVGAIIHNMKFKKIKDKEYNNIDEQKFVIITPIFNEEEDIFKHLNENLNLNYNNYEIWAIDDKSTDNSFEQINKVSNSKLKIYQNEHNIGKAKTLNKFINKVDSEYFIVVDSDTLINKDALKVLNYYINEDKKDDSKNKYVGYTGNVTVYSEYKNTLLYSQKVEYRSFIDMIKRTQFLVTKTILTLSGAFSCYKTSAVKEIGYFNEENATEDINISWRFNQVGKHLKYLPDVKVSVSTPLNVYDLVMQRKRWTIGLFQTIFQNCKSLFSLKNNYLKLFAIEFFASGFWAFTLFFSSIYYIFNILTKLLENLKLYNFIYGILLVLIFSVILSLIAYKLSENDNEKISLFLKHYFWFPFVYYLVQPLGYTYGLKGYLFEREHGKWRKKEDSTSKYLFATVTDILITFIVFRVILEVLEDSYSTFSNLDVLDLLYAFLLIKLVFAIVYYLYLKVGNRFVNKSYPLVFNISLYLTILTFINDFYNVYLYRVKSIPLNVIYKFEVGQLIMFLLIICMLFILFKSNIKVSKDMHDYSKVN